MEKEGLGKNRDQRTKDGKRNLVFRKRRVSREHSVMEEWEKR